MKKHIFILLILALAIPTLYAQTDAKYLKGAVPEENGKVVFSKTIQSTQTISDKDLFQKIELWAQENYKGSDPNNRVLLSNSEKGQIACMGKKELVFGKKLLSYDVSPMTYQLILEIGDGKCEAIVKGINYEYNSNRENDKFAAEDMITDKMAVNKKGDKLNNYYGKFRTLTVDSVNAIFESINKYVNKSTGQPQIQIVYVNQNPAAETSVLQTNTNATSSDALPGFRNILPENIPGNIIKLLSEWTLITSGSGDNTNVMTASWGGLGTFWGKPISTCFLNPTRYSIKTMDDGETYTISFYTAAYKDVLQYCGSNSGQNTDKIKGSGLTPIKTPTGATAFAEAWMIFECRKIIAQPISEASVKIDKSTLSEDWIKDGYHKMYMGEILNVWVK